MNKTEFVKYIADKYDMSAKDAKASLDIVVTSMTEALAEGETIALAGFGTFDIVEKAARTAKNPRTGESVEVPAHKAPRFKFAKSIKDSVR